MASLKSIKKRIISVTNTRQITKAMKMVSAAKLRRAQDNIIAARPFAAKLNQVLQSLAGSLRDAPHPLLEQREARKLLLIIITSDRGLCGGFNNNLCKAGERFLADNRDSYEQIQVITVGRKGYDYFRKRCDIYRNCETIISKASYEGAAALAREVIDGFLEGSFDQVQVLFNSFRSVISQDVSFVQLLPIVANAGTDGDDMPVEYIYEPSQPEILAEILPKNIEVQLFRCVLESIAGEHGARMTAMDSATKNANEMIGKLTLQYNRARQAAITTELMEIISGSESIKG